MMEAEKVEDGAELNVGEDPSLRPDEKQVPLTTTKKDGAFRVHSEVASVTKWLLRHPAVEITDTREIDGQVVACTGTLPIGLLDLKGKPRKSDQFARMLSNATLRGLDGGSR